MKTTHEQENHDLYANALEAAEREGAELEQEIVHVRRLLTRLEARKRAVDEVCGALGRWVELAGDDLPDGDEEEDPFESIFDEQGGAIRLSEEEVSLIAYPDGPPDDADR